MAVSIGFAVLSHNEPEQLLRLVRTLTIMFDAPPIACHHDFSQCPVDVAQFPHNAHFIRPHLETRWGDISVSVAALKALSALQQRADPDWFALLSGSDYPVCPANAVREELSSCPYDAFTGSGEIRFGAVGWAGEAWDRYCVQRWWLPAPSRHLKFGFLPLRRTAVEIRDPRLVKMILMARRCPTRFFGGEFWFQANRKAVSALLTPSTDRLVRYLRGRFVPEEALFHTVFCNNRRLRMGDVKRYVDWSNGGAHPKLLDLVDVPRIVASGAHFARKFRPDGVVQDFLDKAILRL